VNKDTFARPMTRALNALCTFRKNVLSEPHGLGRPSQTVDSRITTLRHSGERRFITNSRQQDNDAETFRGAQVQFGCLVQSLGVVTSATEDEVETRVKLLRCKRNLHCKCTAGGLTHWAANCKPFTALSAFKIRYLGVRDVELLLSPTLISMFRSSVIVFDEL
jgi:hypothetical protein